jgi:hypothetical protein
VGTRGPARAKAGPADLVTGYLLVQGILVGVQLGLSVQDSTAWARGDPLGLAWDRYETLLTQTKLVTRVNGAGNEWT